MEGKEVRFGIGGSALAAVTTSNGATGSYNSMHDSYTPVGGLVTMVNMLLGEVVFGGLGTGLYSLVLIALVGLFIAGLMIGRTPEYLGKQVTVDGDEADRPLRHHRAAHDLAAGRAGAGVIDEPTIRRGEPVPLGAGYYKHARDEARLTEARSRVERFLLDYAQRCSGHGIRYDVVTRIGVPHEQILLGAQRHDLVILPRRSHFHFETERKERDDTVERVLQQCPRPAVTVPAPRRGSGPVVVAYDGGVDAARALHAFATAGVESGSDVLIVSLDEDESEAAERAQNAVAFLASHGIAAHRAVVAERAPAARAILHVVEETDARLLVAGTHSSRRLTDLVFGSVTRILLEEAPVPLLLCG